MAESTGESRSVLATLSDNLAQATRRAASATVRVSARRRLAASGIIWATDGTILTADHVVEQDEGIRIGLPDGREVPATLLGRDPGTDLALLRADSVGQVAVERGPLPEVGSLALAIARPDGAVMATLGVVSAVGGPARTWRGGQLDRFIRTDAVLYPGFSGGPLVDAEGRTTGITTSHLWRGTGLAIPMEVAARVVEAILSHGHVQRGYLGVSSQAADLPQAVAGRIGGQTSGLLIMRVEDGAPADKAGVMLGDILVSLGGEPVRDVDDLQRLLTSERVGKSTDVTVLRGGEPKQLTVSIGDRP